jgi:hypothetical protein
MFVGCLPAKNEAAERSQTGCACRELLTRWRVDPLNRARNFDKALETGHCVGEVDMTADYGQ